MARTQKGLISLKNDNGRIRLRWRYATKRFSLNLSAYTERNLIGAKQIIASIELDMALGSFDPTLQKYKQKLIAPAIIDKAVKKTLVAEFETWTQDIRNMNCNLHSDYFNTRNMIKRWGATKPTEALHKLSRERICPKTYNQRLVMLCSFYNYLKKTGKVDCNPFEDVSKRKVIKIERPERNPLSEGEIKQILLAIKTDRFSVNANKHSHYYPFLYFMFKTGVRNAEAVGLRIKNLNFTDNSILINESLARSLKGTNAAARIRKQTKNGKTRYLPFTDDLKTVLRPLLDNRHPDDLVFLSPKGKAIDDKMFQRRVFGKVLQKLNIPHRNLYALRHTFGSRCINEGFTPVMTAFLMGNNPETALRNYTHQIQLPQHLPNV